MATRKIRHRRERQKQRHLHGDQASRHTHDLAGSHSPPAQAPASRLMDGGRQPLNQLAVLKLQQTHGNSAVQRLLVQREDEKKGGAGKQTKADAPQTPDAQIEAHLSQISQLKAQLSGKAGEERQKLLQDIYSQTQGLIGALEARIGERQPYLLRFQQQRERLSEPGMQFEDQIPAAELDYLIKTLSWHIYKDQAEINVLKRIFEPATVSEFAAKYRTEVRPLPGGGCMTAVYKGLEVLHSKEESEALKKQVQKDAREVLKKTRRDTNSMDRIMETLMSQGKAGAEVELKYKPGSKTWEPDPQATLLSMVDTSIPGWYFFGVSLHGAYHSIIFAVDTSADGAPQIYWMDQFTRGFTKNITGKIPQKMKEYEPSYGFARTRIWPILPSAEAVVEVK